MDLLFFADHEPLRLVVSLLLDRHCHQPVLFTIARNIVHECRYSVLLIEKRSNNLQHIDRLQLVEFSFVFVLCSVQKHGHELLQAVNQPG